MSLQDHSGGLHEFDDLDVATLLVHSAEADVMRTGDGVRTAAWVTPHEVIPKPGPAWRASEYSVRRVERVAGVEDGHVIDLGDRAFQVSPILSRQSGTTLRWAPSCVNSLPAAKGSRNLRPS